MTAKRLVGLALLSMVVNACSGSRAPEVTSDPSDGCASITVCTASCVSGSRNRTTMVDGCEVAQCCVPDDAGTEPDAKVDGCPPIRACVASCVSGSRNVSTLIDGCEVWECCVPDDAGTEPDAKVDACPPITVCTGACVIGSHNVGMVVDGCEVTKCCVPDDAGEDMLDATTSPNDSSAGCTGVAPPCLGTDVHLCCGQDPFGLATCQDGAWMCGSAPAPGCNGTYFLTAAPDACP